MGFYVQSCVKMNYKGEFHPQYVLDPESYTWDPLDGVLKQRMETRKYVCMSRDHEEDGKPRMENVSESTATTPVSMVSSDSPNSGPRYV